MTPPPIPNAEVDYTNAKTGEVLETRAFRDPGLPGTLAYGCGRPLRRPPESPAMTVRPKPSPTLSPAVSRAQAA